MVTWGRGTEALQTTGVQKPGGHSWAMYRCFPAAWACGCSCSRDEGPLPDREQPPDAPGLPPSCAGCLSCSGTNSSRPVCPRCDPTAACPGRARAGQGCRSPANAPQVAVGSSWLGISPHGHGAATVPSPRGPRSLAGSKHWCGASKSVIDVCHGGRCSRPWCLLYKCC